MRPFARFLCQELRFQRGSLTLEATIVFPLFLGLMLVLINFTKVAMVYISMDHAVSETTKQLAAHAYPLKTLKDAPGESPIAEAGIDFLVGAAGRKSASVMIKSYYPLGKIGDNEFDINQIQIYNPGNSEGKTINSIPLNREDIALVVRYRVKLMVPFIPLPEINLSNTAVEKAWADD